jgi:serine phosphatase RsbU (regulator of sigma subunit)
MYTDGLVERRDEPLDAGLDRLRAIVSADSPPRVTREIMRTLIGDEAPADDIALLVVQRTTD